MALQDFNNYPAGGAQNLLSLTATTFATAGAKTLSLAQFVNGLWLRDGGGGNATDTTPSALAIVGSIPNPQVGDAFLFMIRNNSANGTDVITLAGGTRVTITGPTTIAPSTGRIYVGYVTTAGPSGSAAVTLVALS